MTRNVAFLMRASKGGLTHSEIMRLTWRQFQVYLDAFSWLLNEESEKGRAENRLNDLKAQAQDPRVKAWKQKLLEEEKKRRANRKPRTRKNAVAQKLV